VYCLIPQQCDISLFITIIIIIIIIIKSTDAFSVASKASGLEVNAEKNKYMFLSREQNAVESHNMKIGNKFLKDGTVQVFGNKPSQSRLH
jgi:hypothetical protein